MNNFAHIEKAIDMHDDALAAMNVYKIANPDFETNVNKQYGARWIKNPELHKNFAELIYYISTVFPEPDPSKFDEYKEVVGTFFSGKNTLNDRFKIVQQFRDIPPTLLEEVIPIAIARNLFCYEKIHKFYDIDTNIEVNGEKINPFTLFANRYCDLILRA